MSPGSRVYFDLGVENNCSGGCLGCIHGSGSKSDIVTTIGLQTWQAIDGVLGLEEYQNRGIHICLGYPGNYKLGSLTRLARLKIEHALLDIPREGHGPDINLLTTFAQSFLPQAHTLQLQISQNIRSVETQLASTIGLIGGALELCRRTNKNISLSIGVNDIPSSPDEQTRIRQTMSEFHRGLSEGYSGKGEKHESVGHELGQYLRQHTVNHVDSWNEGGEENAVQVYLVDNGHKIGVTTSCRFDNSVDTEPDILGELETRTQFTGYPYVGWFGNSEVNPVHTFRRPKTPNAKTWLSYEIYSKILKRARAIGYSQALLEHFQK